jgi:hypothetical protein
MRWKAIALLSTLLASLFAVAGVVYLVRPPPAAYQWVVLSDSNAPAPIACPSGSTIEVRVAGYGVPRVGECSWMDATERARVLFDGRSDYVLTPVDIGALLDLPVPCTVTYLRTHPALFVGTYICRDR